MAAALRTLVALAALLWLASGCASTSGADPAPVVRAFKDCIATYYEARASGDRADGVTLARRAEAGGRLIDELSKRGVHVSVEEAAQGLTGLVPHVERFLHRRTEDWTLAVVAPPATPEDARRAGADAWPGSVLVGSGVERRSDLTVALAGRRARYARITYGEEACPPFEVWAARSLEEAPRLFLIGDGIYAHRGRFRAPGAPASGPSDVTLEEAVDVAAAGLLFEAERDPARREAMTIVALLDGPRADVALAALRAGLETPAAGIALECLRRAGVEPGAEDAPGGGWPARLARVTPEERRAVIKSASASGGLLDSSRTP